VACSLTVMLLEGSSDNIITPCFAVVQLQGHKYCWAEESVHVSCNERLLDASCMPRTLQQTMGRCHTQ
jgi:hypothetical protein